MVYIKLRQVGYAQYLYIYYAYPTLNCVTQKHAQKWRKRLFSKLKTNSFALTKQPFQNENTKEKKHHNIL